MGLGSIGKSLLNNFIKPMAANAIAQAPYEATQMLHSVAADGFQNAKGTALNFVEQNLPSPLKGLGKFAVGVGLDALQGQAHGWIEKTAYDVTGGQMAPRYIPGYPTDYTMTLPTIDQRMSQMSQYGNTMFNNPTYNGLQYGSTYNPQTAGGGMSAGQSVGGATNLGVSQTWYSENGGQPPDPRKFDMKDPNQAAAFQQQNFNYQMAINNMTNYYQTLSNSYKAQSDTAKAMSGNLR